MSATANVTKTDFYEVLQVTREASDQELKTSYRKLAMLYHPDRNPNNPEAEERFKECSEAYQVLSDPEKRAAYDRYGHAAFQGGGATRQSLPGRSVSGWILGRHLRRPVRRDVPAWAATRRASRVQRGRDLRYDLTLEFEEAVFGVEREISIRRQEACETCSGTGSANGKAPAACTQCGGRGQVRFQQGFFSVARTCSRCNGTGTMISDPCTACRGEGLQAKKHTLLVKVPAGVEQDTRIRYQGEGEGGKFSGPSSGRSVRGAEREACCTSSSRARRRRPALRPCSISFPQAALGAELQIETLEGPAIDQESRGHAERTPVPAARQRRCHTSTSTARARPDRRDPRGHAIEA